MSEERRAERNRELQRAVAIPDQRRAVEAIVKLTGGAYEDAALLWSNEHGHGGDVIGGPNDDHEGGE